MVHADHHCGTLLIAGGVKPIPADPGRGCRWRPFRASQRQRLHPAACPSADPLRLSLPCPADRTIDLKLASIRGVKPGPRCSQASDVLFYRDFGQPHRGRRTTFVRRLVVTGNSGLRPLLTHVRLLNQAEYAQDTSRPPLWSPLPFRRTHGSIPGTGLRRFDPIGRLACDGNAGTESWQGPNRATDAERTIGRPATWRIVRIDETGAGEQAGKRPRQRANLTTTAC